MMVLPILNTLPKVLRLVAVYYGHKINSHFERPPGLMMVSRFWLILNNSTGLLVCGIMYYLWYEERVKI